VLMPRLESALLEIFNACIDEKLSDLNIKWKENATVGVVMSAENYPGTPKKGDLITFATDFENTFPQSSSIPVKTSLSPATSENSTPTPPNLFLYFAGTKDIDGQLYTDGGRVLTLVAQANTREQARELVYQNIDQINFRGEHYRKDIGA